MYRPLRARPAPHPQTEPAPRAAVAHRRPLLPVPPAPSSERPPEPASRRASPPSPPPPYRQPPAPLPPSVAAWHDAPPHACGPPAPSSPHHPPPAAESAAWQQRLPQHAPDAPLPTPAHAPSAHSPTAQHVLPPATPPAQPARASPRAAAATSPPPPACRPPELPLPWHGAPRRESPLATWGAPTGAPLPRGRSIAQGAARRLPRYPPPPPPRGPAPPHSRRATTGAHSAPAHAAPPRAP